MRVQMIVLLPKTTPDGSGRLLQRPLTTLNLHFAVLMLIAPCSPYGSGTTLVSPLLRAINDTLEHWPHRPVMSG